VHNNVSQLAPFHDYVSALVHPTAQDDALVAARHRAFIGSRILGGLLALAVFPIYLVVAGVPGPLAAFCFAWFLLPIASAYFLSRTGRYEMAQVLAALSLAGLITMVAARTGGITSFAACWLIVVPLEVALSCSRRAAAAAAATALAAVTLLFALGTAGALPAAHLSGQLLANLAVFGIVSAALYATAIALRAEALAQTGSQLLSVEEERYHLLARNMSDVITRHGRNGVVLFVSPAAEPLFGTPLRDLSGHGLFDRVHVADRPAYLKALADAAALGEAQSVEFRARREGSDGPARQGPHFIWIEMRVRPLEHDPNDDVREVVAVMRDVTERKAQEQAVEDARSEAERANATKSLFLATMSHELRTPLNAIIGFSEMLMNEETMKIDAARRQDYAHLINDSGLHLLSVVNGILDMSKIETGKFEITPEPFAPGAVIAGCCDILALKAREAGIDLVVRTAENLPEINADKRALKQILLNLVSNAIKFTDRGGRVTVAARPAAGVMTLTVEDTGVGIAEQDLPRLGDPFFQARGSYARPYEGTGLGLSIVRGLVDLHGGTIEIKSRLGEGTCITVRLPNDCETQPRGDTKPRIWSLTPSVPSTESADQQVRKRA
jgi:two-component system, cell cycle sensor histidine kinase DivJ